MDSLQPVERETTASIIADRIRGAIMDGTFAPGAQLGEAQLAGRLQVSRGPVREAMQRLIQEGLLRNERHRGVFVVELGDEDVADIYLARSGVEHTATRVLTERRDTAAFDRLDAILDEMARAEPGDWSTVADHDLRFHEELVEATGSKRLGRMFRTLITETRLCLTELEAGYTRQQDVVEEHREIVRAMRDGDVDRARRLVSAHFDHALEVLTGGEGGADERGESTGS